MATGARSGSSAGNQQQQDNQGQAQVSSIESVKRLNLSGVIFEQVSGPEGSEITMNSGQGDTQALSPADVDDVIRFFGSHQRRSRSGGSGSQQSDGRGQVTDPSTDARLKGNENLRPNDPNRQSQRQGRQRQSTNAGNGGNGGNGNS